MTNQIIQELSKEKTIGLIGYLGGMSWSLLGTNTDKRFGNYNSNPIINFLKNPLSMLLDASAYGVVISTGSLFVASIFPDEIKPIVPISICASVLYYSIEKFV